LRARSAGTLTIEPVLEPHLRALGLYRRRHERRDGRLWDTLSAAPMSTEFALTRFLVPCCAGPSGPCSAIATSSGAPMWASCSPWPTRATR
jgi:hypothetical protein